MKRSGSHTLTLSAQRSALSNADATRKRHLSLTSVKESYSSRLRSERVGNGLNYLAAWHGSC